MQADRLAPLNDGMHLELYRRFTEARPEFDTVGKIMPYGWTKLPDPLEAIWMAYSFMLDDFARELANAMNGFTRACRADAAVCCRSYFIGLSRQRIDPHWRRSSDLTI